MQSKESVRQREAMPPKALEIMHQITTNHQCTHHAGCPLVFAAAAVHISQLLNLWVLLPRLVIMPHVLPVAAAAAAGLRLCKRPPRVLC